MIVNKSRFLEDKNLLTYDTNHKGRKGNIKYYHNKRNIINVKNNIYNYDNNMIGYKFQNITLKKNGTEYKDILGSSFESIYYPNIIYINGKQNFSITYNYYFNETNNILNLIWNNAIDNHNNFFSKIFRYY